MDSSVGAMASGVLTATAIAADAITDAKVASDVTIASVTGAVGSVSGAVGSVTAAVSVTGDFSATMKTSIGTAVAASAVASVTGDVGGNVTGSVGSVAGLTASNLDATVSSRLAAASYTAPDNTSITGIKAKTDSLNFTVAGKLDTNVLVVNGVTLTGDGTVGTPWGPA